jgi:hypothetical protein
MAEIRGEKVSFSRKEIVPLHELPSAQVEDPMIVHCPPRRSRVHRVGRTASLFLTLVLIAICTAVFAIEGGIVDGALSARAQAALNNAIGPRYVASVGSTVIRFDTHFRLAIEARDVDVVEQASGEHLSRAGALRLAIDPLALLGGRVSIKHMEAQDIRLETAQLPEGQQMPLSKVRVDATPRVLEQAFQRLDEARGLIERSGTASVRISGIQIVLPTAPGQEPLRLEVEALDLALRPDGEVEIKGDVSLNGRKATLLAASQTTEGVTTALSAKLSGLDVTPFLLQRASDGTPREGIEGALDLEIAATRAREATTPAMTAVLHQSPGRFFFDSIPQVFSGAEINVAYDFAKDSIEIRQSEARFGPTVLPLTGAILDINRLDPNDKRLGFGLDLLVSGGTAVGATEGEEPAHFDLKAVGRYLSADRELQFDQMGVSSPTGTMAGSLRVRFGDKSPEVSFGAQLPKMDVSTVKQLWPFWMARKPRDWVMANLFSGTLTNGSIAVFIPQGRMKGPGIPMELDKNELQIGFDLSDSRLNMPGDVPPLRDISAHLDLKGEVLKVDIAKATSFLPSGRSVTVENSTFSLPATYTKPLMAEMSLQISGSTDAVTELANSRPVNALKGTGYKPEDFGGSAKAQVTARMGLLSDQNPPKPVWTAHVDLADVDLVPQIANRKIANLTGTLDIDPQSAHLSGKALIDTVPAEVTLVEPLDPNSAIKRERIIKASLSNDQREKLVPGLSDIVDGTVGVELARLDETRQGVTLDLSKASLSVPWLGWTKGSGIRAKAQFEVSGEGSQRTDIRNFVLDGDGFGVRGSFALADGNLSTADLTNVQLSPADNYSVALKRSKGIYDITVGGSAADLRPIITKLRASTGGGRSGSGGGKDSGKDSGGATLRGKLDKAVGFNDESLSNVNMLFSMRDGKISTADLSALTGSGQAVVSEMARGDTISFTSGDAGAVVRFANLYSNLRGGLLNLRLKAQGSDWLGSVDIRSFSLANESRLQSLVSSPVGRDGESLSTAVKKNIDVSSAKFQRAYAALAYQSGSLSIANGVVRGEQIGATFQGMLRDSAGNMEMTGTFMPAYGLNRLFGELPLIGAILGNGNDRGLLGITFKLQGPFEKPKLAINPLSLIAPGVFRQIFEFQ